MKELSIEEKAKRYDEALEKSKRLYEQGTITESLCYVFPELKESEDEKVREYLIRYIDNTMKSSELKSKLLAWLEKQGEQKPTDKVEPKFKVKYAGSEYNVFETKDIAGVTFYGIEDEPNHIDYVKAENCEIISVYAIKENGSPYPTKPAVFSEKKPKRMISAEAKEAMYDKPACAWSEEDEEYINDLIGVFDGQQYQAHSDEEIVKWLKSIRLPYNKEWDENDEEMLRSIIATCELAEQDRDSSPARHLLEMQLNWLKTLKQKIKGE